MLSLVNPKNIAIVGASINPHKVGSSVLSNIINGGYKGEIFPVNPKYRNIGGRICYKSISEVPHDIDVAVIAIPSNYVLDVIQECINKNVKNCVVISSGFKESGEEGKMLEDKIKSLIENSGTRLLGVNTLGYINSEINLNVTFAKQDIKYGSIALVSQSGAIGTSVLDYLSEFGLGLKYFFSIGNKTDINEIDIINEIKKDTKLKAIALYLEDVSNYRNMIDLLNEISHILPIILIKPGNSKESKQAISSHTGALIKDTSLDKLLFDKYGVIQVDNVREFFYLIHYLSIENVPQGDAITLLTNAGGPSVLMTDQLINNELKLQNISNQTKTKLKNTLPEGTSLNNPIDILGDANPKRFYDSLSIICENNNIKNIVVLITPQSQTDVVQTVSQILHIKKQYPYKTIILSIIGGKQIKTAKEICNRNNLPLYEYPEDIAKLLSNLNKFILNKNHSINFNYSFSKRDNIEVLSQIIYQMYINDRKINYILLNESLVKSGFNTCNSYYPKDLESAVNYLNLNTQIVIKSESPDIKHRKDLGLVYTNVNSIDTLEKYWNDLNLKTQKITNNYSIKLQNQIKGFELILGINRVGDYDRNKNIIDGLGYVLILGSGGSYTEIYNDNIKIILPENINTIKQKFINTSAGKILSGYRGDKFNIDSLFQIIESLTYLTQITPIIKNIEVNPLIINDNDSYIADIKIEVE